MSDVSSPYVVFISSYVVFICLHMSYSYEWRVVFICRIHTHMDESVSYSYVVFICVVTHMDESYGWVMSHIWMSPMDESCHTYGWVRVVFICRIYMSYSYVVFICVDLFIRVTWRIPTCDTTQSYMWHDLFIYVTGLIHMCDMTRWNVRHDASVSVTWLVHICMTWLIHVWHDGCTCICIHKWVMSLMYESRPLWISRIHVRHDSFICKARRIHVWHDSFIRVTWLIDMCDMTHWHMYDRTHSRV